MRKRLLPFIKEKVSFLNQTVKGEKIMNKTASKETKKKWQTPHTFVILVTIILIAAIATYFVPAGQFVRYKDAVTGKTLVKAGSYALTQANPTNFLQLPVIVYKAIVNAANIEAFIFIIGGAFEIITSTAALTTLCHKMSRIFEGKAYFVIPIFLTLFALFGTTMGMSTEVMIFVPIGITLAYSLGLDKVTGTAMITMGTACGFTAGLLNPFNVGIAQDIAQIPLFSGMWLRALLLIVLLIVDTIYIIHYAKKVKACPEKGILYGEPEEDTYAFTKEDSQITGRQVGVLLALFAGFAVLIYGLSKLGWYYEEMSGLFLAMGILCGIIAGYGPNKIASTFSTGAKNICVGALIIGVAASIQLILTDASILDTIVNSIASLVANLPHLIQAVGMFFVQSLINCVITSGSGQAVVTMPLMVPLADLLGISRQTAVLAFQMGDGFSNSILPTSSALMGYLIVSKIPYSKWLKFMVPLFLIWTAIGCVFMMIAVAVGY